MAWQVSKKDPSGRLEEWVEETATPLGRSATVTLAAHVRPNQPEFWDAKRWVSRGAETGERGHDFFPLVPRPLGEIPVAELGDRDPLDDIERERERRRRSVRRG